MPPFSPHVIMALGSPWSHPTFASFHCEHINAFSIQHDPDEMRAWQSGAASALDSIMQWFENFNATGQTLVVRDDSLPVVWTMFANSTDAVMAKLAWGDYAVRR